MVIIELEIVEKDRFDLLITIFLVYFILHFVASQIKNDNSRQKCQQWNFIVSRQVHYIKR